MQRATAPFDQFNVLSGITPPSGVVQQTSGDSDPNRQSRKKAFLDRDVDIEIYNSHTLQTSMSPYQVMAGTIISTNLVMSLNSDLPGQVIAQVTDHVYNTPTGQYLLIPQDSRLIGRYDSVIVFGQSRAHMVWNRLIMPTEH